MAGHQPSRAPTTSLTSRTRPIKIFLVICIGAKKCGTGAFQNFLAHHPHLHKPPGLDEGMIKKIFKYQREK